MNKIQLMILKSISHKEWNKNEHKKYLQVLSCHPPQIKAPPLNPNKKHYFFGLFLPTIRMRGDCSFICVVCRGGYIYLIFDDNRNMKYENRNLKIKNYFKMQLFRENYV